MFDKQVKVCNTCKIEKPYVDFTKNPSGKTVWNRCKKCSAKKQYDKIRNNPQLRKDIKLRWRYGIGLEDYNQMVQEQEGKCLICERHQSELDKSLRVDHNHETGEIRGLLCDQCNTAIGLFKEDVEIMKKAISYIEVN